MQQALHTRPISSCMPMNGVKNFSRRCVISTSRSYHGSMKHATALKLGHVNRLDTFMTHAMSDKVRGSRQGETFIETAVRQELGLQSNRLPDNVRERVEEAIKRQRYKTTVGEVAAQAGVKLSEAEDALKALAYDSQAVLQVSSEGDVVYSFSPDFQSAIRGKSFMLRTKPLLMKVQTALGFLIRITFGTALFASIIVTFLAITVLLNSSDRRSDDRRDGGYGGGGMGMRMGFFPDLWWFWSPNYSSRPRSDSEEMSLPEAIFSFVFGDGDPNTEYDATRWRALGRFIQSRNGVVTAEEMAPFLDRSTSSTQERTGVVVDEAYVLPALIKFGGEPFVDEEGQLLYKFPSLQKTVLQREVVGRRFPQRDRGDDSANAQYEQNWELTAASSGQLVAIIGLGILNVVGVVTLGNFLADPYSKTYLVRQGLGWIVAAMPALSAYAAAFFGIPAFRFVRNLFQNKAIDARNDAREEAARELVSPSGQLAAKLESARKLGQQKLISQRDIMFTTEQDSSQLDAREMDEWDRKLDANKGSAGRAGAARRDVSDGW